MSLVKSFSVGDGDMFFIRHGSDSFTMIDCCMSNNQRENLVDELRRQSSDRGITRFISTHPDDDHIRGLAYLDDRMPVANFYCVENAATKPDQSDDFDRYCSLRDSKKAFPLHTGCTRKWLNQGDAERGNAGIGILWPQTTNVHYRGALADAANGESPNNISAIVQYSLKGGVTMLWMGDLETEFMESIEDDLQLSAVDILFAPHHGRDTGKVPESLLNKLSPKIIVIGEAPAQHLNYYQGYDTITQNSAGNIVFDCTAGFVHVYVSSDTYSVDFLVDYPQARARGYIGTLEL